MPSTSTTLVVAALIAIVAAPNARAEGLNLSWDDCGNFGVSNKSFACNTNDAVFTLVGSLIRDAPDSVVTVGGTLIIDADELLLPDWWKFRDNSPGTNSPVACQDSGLFAIDDGQATSCPTLIVDPRSGGNYGWFPTTNFPDIGQISFSTGSLSATETFLEPGTEYAYFRLILHPTRTTGPGACAGCSSPLTITLTRGVLVRLDIAENYTITEPATRNFVRWDGGPVPVDQSTWGAIKRLYR